MRLLFIFAVILFCSFFVSAQNYDCVKLNADEATREGYSFTLVSKEKKSVKVLRGTVILDATKDLLENVFVEVFAVDSKGKELNRVAGCRTGKNGRFYFSDIAKGKYILRLSKDGGFAITEIRVKVSPENGRDKEIIGTIMLGV